MTEADVAREQIAQLREALEPFARALDEWMDDPQQPDHWNTWEHPLAIGVTIGDFRRARAALAATGEQP